MSVYLQFPSGWWNALALVYISYIVIFLHRGSYKNHKELKAQLLFALAVLVLSLLFEYIAVYYQIWTYFPGNWPIVLWPAYFGGGLLSFQLIKKIEELV